MTRRTVQMSARRLPMSTLAISDVHAVMQLSVTQLSTVPIMSQVDLRDWLLHQREVQERTADIPEFVTLDVNQTIEPPSPLRTPKPLYRKITITRPPPPGESSVSITTLEYSKPIQDQTTVDPTEFYSKEDYMSPSKAFAELSRQKIAHETILRIDDTLMNAGTNEGGSPNSASTKSTVTPKAATPNDSKKNSQSAKARQQKAKDSAQLPEFLLDTTDDDMSRLHCIPRVMPLSNVENPFPVAIWVPVSMLPKITSAGKPFLLLGSQDFPDFDWPEDTTDLLVNLDGMKAYQWRTLGRLMKLKSTVLKQGEIAIRFALGNKHELDKLAKKGGLERLKLETVRTVTIIRLINCIAMEGRRERFFSLRDLKKRVDHETKNVESAFYQDLVDCFNDRDNNDDLLRSLYNHICPLLADKLKDVNLDSFDLLSTKEAKSIVSELGKVYTRFYKLINQSGQHNGDPWNFVEVASKDATNIGHTEAVYWFHFCKENPETDAFYGLNDSGVEGGSSEVLQTGDKPSSKKRKQPPAADDRVASALEKNTKLFADAFKERNDLLRERNKAESRASTESSFHRSIELLSTATDPTIKKALKNNIIRHSKNLGDLPDNFGDDDAFDLTESSDDEEQE